MLIGTHLQLGLLSSLLSLWYTFPAEVHMIVSLTSLLGGYFLFLFFVVFFFFTMAIHPQEGTFSVAHWACAVSVPDSDLGEKKRRVSRE